MLGRASGSNLGLLQGIKVDLTTHTHTHKHGSPPNTSSLSPVLASLNGDPVRPPKKELFDPSGLSALTRGLREV